MRKYIHYLLIAAILILPINAYCADQWDKTLPQDTTLIPAFPAMQRENNGVLDRVLQEYRRGAKLAYNSASSIDVGDGELACSNSAGTDREFRAQSSTIEADWTDIDTGSEETSTTYYVYAVCDTDIEGWTVLISKNSSAPTGATQYRRVGSFYNDSSGNITLVNNDDERFVVATGTISNGGTISLPSGYSQDECSWTVAINSYDYWDDIGGASCAGNNYFNCTVNSSRVVSCSDYDGGGGSCLGGSETANYIIICQR